MHNLASVLKYQTHKVLRDFKRQTNHPIPARRLEQVTKKENLPNNGFCCPGRLHREKIKVNDMSEKYSDLAR